MKKQLSLIIKRDFLNKRNLIHIINVVNRFGKRNHDRFGSLEIAAIN